MGKVIAFLAFCCLLALAATCALAEDQPSKLKPQQTQKVVQLKPTSGTLTVNDFHIRFKGQIQTADQAGILKWLDVQLSDLDQTQLHCSKAAQKVADAMEGWIELSFTFPDTVLTPAQGMSFGFAVNGGVNITDYESWWTNNGANVKNVPKVVTGAKVETEQTKLTVTNLKDTAVSVQRKIGKNTTKPSMPDLADMMNLPDEELVDVDPVPITPYSWIEYGWPEPPLEPGVVSRTYYQRTFVTAEGVTVSYTEAFTVQVIPEPSAFLGVAAGLLGLGGMIRRRR